MDFEVMMILGAITLPSVVINIVSWILMDRWMARKYKKFMIEVRELLKEQIDKPA